MSYLWFRYPDAKILNMIIGKCVAKPDLWRNHPDLPELPETRQYRVVVDEGDEHSNINENVKVGHVRIVLRGEPGRHG